MSLPQAIAICQLLEVLNISGCTSVTDAGITALCGAPMLRELSAYGVCVISFVHVAELA